MADNMGVVLSPPKSSNLLEGNEQKPNFCHNVDEENISKLCELKGRVEFFKKCGRSAQLLVLENGGWNRLNQWTKFAISYKDSCLMKEILNVLLTMPTCCSHLLENRQGLPMTLQELLKRLVLESNEFGEDSELVKMLSCQVFAKWLLVKKRQTEETFEDRISVIDSDTEEDGDKGGAVIARIEHVPGYGYFAKNGEINVVQIKAARCPPLLPPPPPPPLPLPFLLLSPSSFSNDHVSISSASPCPSRLDSDSSDDMHHDTASASNVGDDDDDETDKATAIKSDYCSKTGDVNVTSPDKEVLNINNNNNTRRNQASKVFVTSKSRSENLLEEMMLPKSSEISPSKKLSPPPLVSPELSFNIQKLEEMFEEKVGQTPKNQLYSPPKNSPPSPQRKKIKMHENFAVDEFEDCDLLLENIGRDLGKPKKLVRWWGSNGVMSVHHYESWEIYERTGFVKEKWSSFTMVDSENDSNDSDSMIIDRDEDCVVENEVLVQRQKKLLSASSSMTERRAPDVMNMEVRKDAAWRCPQKIYFSDPNDIFVSRVTEEMNVQKLRESMVVQVDLCSGSTSPDSPEGSDDDDDDDENEMTMKETDDKVERGIATPVIISTADVIEYRKKQKELTEIHDYSQSKWPEPKGPLDPRAIKRW